MLLEAKERKMREIKAVRNKEIAEVRDLKQEIEKEHKMK